LLPALISGVIDFSLAGGQAKALANPGQTLRAALIRLNEGIRNRAGRASISRPRAKRSTISCFYGYTTNEGSEGVRKAATYSVVISSLAIILTDVILVKCIFFVFPDQAI
jgi:hypothetical protein